MMEINGSYPKNIIVDDMFLVQNIQADEQHYILKKIDANSIINYCNVETIKIDYTHNGITNTINYSLYDNFETKKWIQIKTTFILDNGLTGSLPAYPTMLGSIIINNDYQLIINFHTDQIQFRPHVHAEVYQYGGLLASYDFEDSWTYLTKYVCTINYVDVNTLRFVVDYIDSSGNKHWEYTVNSKIEYNNIRIYTNASLPSYQFKGHMEDDSGILIDFDPSGNYTKKLELQKEFKKKYTADKKTGKFGMVELTESERRELHGDDNTTKRKLVGLKELTESERKEIYKNIKRK